MTAGVYCNREVVIAAPDAAIVEAARLMRDRHVGDLVVVNKEAGQNLPIGIVTDRDLVVEVLAQEVPLDVVTIKDVMSTDLVIVREEETMLTTLALMRSRGVRRVVVVNAHGGLEGILSADDAIELISEALDSLVKLVRREIRREEKERL